MKNHLLILPFLVLLACNNKKAEQPADNKNLLSTDLVQNANTASGVDTATLKQMAVMVIPDTMYDFGIIHEGETVEHQFQFKNTGSMPLIISAASSSCGCTVPEYPSEPVAPGGEGVLKVKYNSSGKKGHEEKTVTILTNSTRGTHYLYIKGDITTK